MCYVNRQPIAKWHKATGVAYLTIFGHMCCGVVGHSQSRRRGRETIKRYDVTETYSHVVRQNLSETSITCAESC